MDHPGPGHGPQPVRLAGGALPDLGAHRRTHGLHGGPGLARHDGPRRGHHRHGPPLRLPARHRRPVRRDHPRRPRDGRPLHPRPRLHGPRRVGRRTAPGLRRGEPGRRARRDRGHRRGAPRPLLRRHDPGRRRALLPLLRLHRTDAQRGRVGPPARRTAAHARLGDRGGGEVLPRAVRHGPDRLLRVHRLAGRGRVDGALRPHERLRHRRLRPHRDRRRPLPLVQRPARRGHRPGPGHARRRRPGRPRCRRHRLQRVRRTPHRAAQRPAHQPARRPQGVRAQRPPGPAARHPRGRPRPRPGRRDRLAGGGQAGRRGAVEAGHTGPRLHRRPGDRPGLRRGRPGHRVLRERPSDRRGRTPVDRRRGRRRARHPRRGPAPGAARRSALTPRLRPGGTAPGRQPWTRAGPMAAGSGARERARPGTVPHQDPYGSHQDPYGSLPGALRFRSTTPTGPRPRPPNGSPVPHDRRAPPP
ncbi:putative Uncharacterized 50.6 kDa protein in the 5'region of gyrA and gyrB [Streptomyces murinus]